jgi:two-component system response regulator FlrC
VGGSRTIEADVRWIAATNRDADELLRSGALREDLYHRLAVFPIHLPPLRERRQDIPPIVETLLARIGRDIGRSGLGLDDDARRLVLAAPWPGNVRELSNALERAAILAGGPRIRAEHLELRTPSGVSAKPAAPRTLEEIEREAIDEALRAADGNRREAAQRLGIGLRTLYDKLKLYRTA